MKEFFERRDVRIFVVLLLAAAAVWFFAEIADEVMEGSTKSFDKSIILMFREKANPGQIIGPYWMEEAVRDVTALGSAPVLILFLLIITVYLILIKERRKAFYVTAAAITGSILVTFLKELFSRERPPEIFHLALEKSLSFPSAHSAMSAVVYLTLALLLNHYISKRYLRIYLIVVAVILTGIVGISRIVLGLHYPTDVAAGWAFGFAWALLSRLILNYSEFAGRYGDTKKHLDE